MTTALTRFNEDADAAREILLAAVRVPRWADEIVAGRPYAGVEDVVRAAETAADPWTDEEVDGALARHPRIGERATGDDPDAAHSAREQAGVDGSDASVAERLRAGNLAYEERFGHVFLIRAAGRDAEEILAALEQRLTNDPATERRVCAEQLREIAVLRLKGELA
ncbi:2-oxo-4-hydroxy-4-carboxy-5-ureidoimidazoline decarboxylase [Georgenia sp. Z1344]|uniref:2-oxo-4-hydroxy-4-carboxy-5-ureidoimidazoline decarboxylase n=1 Tax=Georgenia sp. Z1344 TaxID=3416706 RepID=UPI003CF24890